MGLELALVGDVGVAAASGQGDFVEEWGAGGPAVCRDTSEKGWEMGHQPLDIGYRGKGSAAYG